MDVCITLSNVNWSLTKDFFAVVGTFISAVGVTAAIYFGFVGLSTWRRQAKGSNDHDLSRRILLGLYKYREAINRVRFPTFKNREAQIEEGIREGLDITFSKFRWLEKAYDQRLNEVLRCRSELNVDLVEGNAVWEKKLTALFDGIDDLERELFTYVLTYLGSMNPNYSIAMRLELEKELERFPNILYDDLSREGDDYRKRMNLESVKVQDFLVTKMIR